MNIKTILTKYVSRIFLKSEIYSYRSLTKNLTQVDFKVISVCVITALVLTCNYYVADYRFLIATLYDLNLNGYAQQVDVFMHSHEDAHFHQKIYWASVVIFFYFAVPAFFILCVFKEKLSDYGLRTQGAFKDYQLYVWMLFIMMPLVIYFSNTHSFQESYPFLKISEGEGLYPNFLIWELFYFVQFFALEFFFRGFILHGTKQRFGFYAIFIMMIPYCMIHFGKPFIETIAAIIAGVALGALSLKSRSIWLGVAIHCSVALAMDLSALYRKGLL